VIQYLRLVNNVRLSRQQKYYIYGMKMIHQQINSPADASFMVKQYFQSHFTAPFHFHHEYELILIAKSYGKLYAGNRVVNFTDGDVYFFGPGFAHCFYNDKAFIESKQTAHAIVIQFREDFLGKAFFDNAELRKIKSLLSLSCSGIKINKPSKDTTALFNSLTQCSGMQSLILLLQLLDILSNQKKNSFSYITAGPQNVFNGYDPGKMEAVFKYILENFKTEVISKTAASIACMNEAAFCRYFKRRTRKTFSQFVNEVRITHATRLLMNNASSIMDICFECGFNNISYFNRQFKTIIGKTPFDYRKEFAA
jgi:AraC-like DNA-binding protein